MSPSNARKFMELAIEVMKRSIAEPRDDGKASPRVGAVLVKPDGTVTTAYRGELRHGDHAEFTLLERKHRHEGVDGAILFATLEPCAPKARNFPKLGCAERIVLARVRAVWVGIEDPDPMVDRKGIRHLEDHGIEVHMFDRDLQQIIQNENKDFIEQALERRATAEESKPKEVTLSPLEGAISRSLMDDLDPAVLEKFRLDSSIRLLRGTPEFDRRLIQMGLAKESEGRLSPTGFGLLLFGKEPRLSMRQAGLLGTIHFPNGKEEIQNFDGPQIMVPDLALRWLRDKLPNVIDRSDAKRRSADAPIFEVIREGIVNALVHRDYDIEGAKCQLIVNEDVVEIRSPGKPVSPLTLAQLQSFDAPMLSRNPVLHYVFSRMGLAEERGLGLKSMRQRAKDASLPLPTYSWDDPYLVLRVYRTSAAATRTLPEATVAAMSSVEKAGWEWLRSQGHTTSSSYAEARKLDTRSARRHLNRFVELGLVRKSGAGPATTYEVAK